MSVLPRYSLQKDTNIVLCKQDGSAGRYVFCKGLADVVFGEHQRQTLAHLVSYWTKQLSVSVQTIYIGSFVLFLTPHVSP